MIRVLKADLFRMFRTKAFYVFPIFTVCFLFVEMFASASSVAVSELGEAAGTTIAIGPTQLLDCLQDGMLMLFLGIFLVIFCTDESRNGFLKNAVGTVSRRAIMPVSKIIVGIVTLFIYIVEFAVIKICFILAAAGIGGQKPVYSGIPEGDMGRYIIFLMLCILVHIVIVSLLVAMHELTHNRAIGIVFIFLYAGMLLGKIIIALGDLVNSLLGLASDFETEHYLMLNSITGGYNGAGFSPSRLLIVCLIWGCLSVTGALLLSEKRDIKL